MCLWISWACCAIMIIELLFLQCFHAKTKCHASGEVSHNMVIHTWRTSHHQETHILNNKTIITHIIMTLNHTDLAKLELHCNNARRRTSTILMCIIKMGKPVSDLFCVASSYVGQSNRFEWKVLRIINPLPDNETANLCVNDALF